MSQQPTIKPLLVEDLSGKSGSEILDLIKAQDKANEEISTKALHAELELFEKGLKLIEDVLIFASENIAKWSPSDRVVIAMIARAHNHLLAESYLLRKGYWAESALVSRGVHETISRILYFYWYPEEVNIFLDGATIWPSEVRRKLTEKIEQEEAEDVLKEIYSFLSEHAHPNLDALKLQTWSEQDRIKENIGSKAIVGGFLHASLVKQQFASLLAELYSTTKVLAIVGLHDATDTWPKEFKEFESQVQSLMSSLGVKPED